MRDFLLATFAIVILIPGGAFSDENLSANWSDLWTRCRISIETVQPLNTKGLFLRNDSRHTNTKNYERYSRWRIWRGTNSRLAILEAEYDTHNGTVRRVCYVEPTPGSTPLSSEDEDGLVRAFLIERSNLIAQNRHEERDSDQIFPIIPLGVGPKNLNSNGCIVISFLLFDPSSDFFTSGTGEQSNSGCSGPSFFEN